MEDGKTEMYIELLEYPDTDRHGHEDKIFGLNRIKLDPSGLYGVIDCTNAIIACTIDRITMIDY